MSICRVKHEDAIVDFAHKGIPDSGTLVRPLTEDDVKYTKMKALQDLACSRGVVIGANTMAWDIRDVLLGMPVDASAARTKEINRVAFKLLRAESLPDVAEALLNVPR